jgi:deoxycytidylate deaminase
VYYLARERALNNGRVYHIAAILRRGKHIVKIGVNSSKTHPQFGRVYPDGSCAYHMHAEMDALRFAQPGDTLEVMRFRKSDNEYAIAKPCEFCMKHIIEAGIKKVKYTNDLGEWETMRVFPA